MTFAHLNNARKGELGDFTPREDATAELKLYETLVC
jgi:hypothetical protein